ncbi:MAG: AEC family transporter [Oscillospiraceae bacterium]
MSLSLLNQIVVIFLLAAAGYAARKSNILNQQTQLGLSNIVLNLAIPASILASAAKPLEAKNFTVVITILIGAVVYYLFSIFMANLLSRLMKLPRGRGTIFTLLVAFANVAFIGYPVISIFLPENGIFFASFYVIIFNLSFFTYGVATTSTGEKLSPLAIFGNINNIAAFVMVVLYLLQIRFPAPVQQTLELLGNLSTPLSMLVIGSMLATIKLRQLFATPTLYFISFLRLLVLPTLVFLVLRWLGITGDAATVLLIVSGLPSASVTVMIAEKNNAEPEYATKGVLLSTILFMATVPYLAFLHGLL